VFIGLGDLRKSRYTISPKRNEKPLVDNHPRGTPPFLETKLDLAYTNA
jgi:hypothetical protein